MYQWNININYLMLIQIINEKYLLFVMEIIPIISLFQLEEMK